MALRSTDAGTPDADAPFTKRRPSTSTSVRLRAEVAQVDLGRARADAAAVGRIAEVAGVVELAVEAAGRAREALQHVVDRVETGLRDVLLVDERDRRIRSSGSRRMREPVTTMSPLAASSRLTVVVAGAC